MILRGRRAAAHENFRDDVFPNARQSYFLAHGRFWLALRKCNRFWPIVSYTLVTLLRESDWNLEDMKTVFWVSWVIGSATATDFVQRTWIFHGASGVYAVRWSWCVGSLGFSSNMMSILFHFVILHCFDMLKFRQCSESVSANFRFTHKGNRGLAFVALIPCSCWQGSMFLFCTDVFGYLIRTCSGYFWPI